MTAEQDENSKNSLDDSLRNDTNNTLNDKEKRILVVMRKTLSSIVRDLTPSS